MCGHCTNNQGKLKLSTHIHTQIMIQTKNSRIDLRVTSEQKQLLEQAASIKGISLSAYTLSYLLEIAQKDINNYEKLLLSNQDRDLLLSVIENPPQLQGKLATAIKEYRQKYEE